MKKILTVYTGGTIGCALSEGHRALDTALSKRYIALRFSQSDSPYAGISAELFEDSLLEKQTLSENMTLAKLQRIIEHIGSFDLGAYAGVMIMHGTDTLAYTAALLSMALCSTPVPIMLISAARPPMDELTNAHANFRAGAELICAGIAPNVYVPYRNTDGRVRLHLGSRLMQCPNFSDDFTSAGESFFVDTQEGVEKALAASAVLSANRGSLPAKALRLENSLLVLHPHTGLDYSRLSLEGVQAVIHGTYHSGTFCVERTDGNEDYSTVSVLYLADKCRERGVPVFAAPCVLGEEQYSSVFDGVKAGGIIPLSMTGECAYAKALAGIACGLSGDGLKAFMQKELNNEII